MSGSRRRGPNNSEQASKRLKSGRSKTVDLGWKENGAENDEIVDSDDDDYFDERAKEESSLEEEEEEPLDSKRVRMAREFLTRMEEEEDSSDDEEEDDEEGPSRDRISLKLQETRLKQQGLFETAVADEVGKQLNTWSAKLPTPAEAASPEQDAKRWQEAGAVKLFRGHDLTATCVSLQEDGTRALSGSKDNSVILWDTEKEAKISNLCKHWKKSDTEAHRSNGEVLALACSEDGRYTAVGRRDATVAIYDVRLAAPSSPVAAFKGHKAAVTTLAFRSHSYSLFSGSEDRCIRHYSLDEMAYLETLYGHQAGVTAIDCHRKERPISVGRDRTARAWKLSEDTHLIFRGGSTVSSADCLAAVKDDWFVTGHDDGNLALWFTEKKRAVATIENAHGLDRGVGRGLSSVAALKSSDLVMTGSNDGHLRLWKARTGPTLDERGLDGVGEIPLHGFINSIAIGPSGRFCVFALGQEPRLGRWSRVARAKNRFGILTIERKE